MRSNGYGHQHRPRFVGFQRDRVRLDVVGGVSMNGREDVLSRPPRIQLVRHGG